MYVCMYVSSLSDGDEGSVAGDLRGRRKRGRGGEEESGGGGSEWRCGASDYVIGIRLM